MSQSIVFDNLIELLPSIKKEHQVGSPLYQFLKSITRTKVEEVYKERPSEIFFKPFGNIYFPYCSMGAMDTLNFFDMDELIIFGFYWANRNTYKTVLDLGANIGFHTIILNRCGYVVRSYEPDPVHFEKLQENLKKNRCSSEIHNVAISSKNGTMEFIRVLGNTTGNHLKGSKANPYGDLEYIHVKTTSFKDILRGGADLIKMDIEGHEKEVLLSTTEQDWDGLDLLVEVNSEKNAHEIFGHADRLGLNLFSQKTGWGKAQSADKVPWSYKEGTLFMTKKDEMPWGS